MPVFVVALLRFTDEDRYRRYQRAFAEVFATSGGRLLAADEAPVCLEGEWAGDKVVIMEFPNADAATAFLQGPRYQAISTDRLAGAETTALLVRGWHMPAPAIGGTPSN